MRESSLWSSLKSSKQLDFAVRIESSTSPGIPDVYFATGTGITGWIELKVVPDTRRKLLVQGTGHGQLRPLQVLWAKQATEKNIFSCVLLSYRKQEILVSCRDISRLLDADAKEVMSAALWIGGVTPRLRWQGLKDKLEKHGQVSIIQMATGSDQ